ncbi:MAG: hypothetical protein NTY46_14015, partial [Candidatus Sumerlaeota bacterium]|nr:hypothetical protein [Candidatus Sumerlaeota bacterium]
YFPRCIASTRTCREFIKRYKGHIYKYTPVPQENYGYSKQNILYKIDDYRNPICASIGLTYRFNVKKLLLFCCDELGRARRIHALHTRTAADHMGKGAPCRACRARIMDADDTR